MNISLTRPLLRFVSIPNRVHIGLGLGGPSRSLTYVVSQQGETPFLRQENGRSRQSGTETRRDPLPTLEGP